MAFHSNLEALANATSDFGISENRTYGPTLLNIPFGETLNSSNSLNGSINQTITLDNLTMSSGEQAVLYITYIVAILLAVIGNISSIVVFAKGKRCNTDIKVFLINLAVADLMMALICLPFSFSSALIQRWIWSKPMCPIVLFTQMLSVTVSVYTNTAISIDRFFAIKYPLKLMKYSRFRIKCFIAIIWTVSVGLCAIQFRTARVSDKNQCEEQFWGEHMKLSRQIYTIAVFVITYVIPVFIIVIMYTLVCKELWFQSAPGVGDVQRDARQLGTKKKVVTMLIVMVVLFTISWMPLQIFFLIIDFAPAYIQSLPMKPLSIAYFICHVLAMSNSFQNPIIYGFLNENFRADWAEMVLTCCPSLSSIKALQSAALTNKPLSRHSTQHSYLYGSRYDSPRNAKRFSSSSNRSLPTNSRKQSEPLINIRQNPPQLFRSYTDNSDRITSYRTDSHNSAKFSLQEKINLMDTPLPEELEQL